MASYTAELKDNNEDVVYPITTADSVVDSDNVSLQTRVNNGVFTGTGTIETITPWVNTSDIVDDAVTSGKVDFDTFTAYSANATMTALTQTYANYLTVDVTKIPAGKKFVALFVINATGSDTLTAILGKTKYNNVDSLEAATATQWGKCIAGMGFYTKVDGVNSLYLQSKKDNSSTVNITARECICYVIG